MFGMSFTEIVIIAILALVLLGPDKLPDAAKNAGKLMRQLRSVTDDLKGQFENEIMQVERQVKPSLVPPVPALGSLNAPVPGPAGPPPPATAQNVPGLEAALVELDAPVPAVTPTAAATSSSPATPATPAATPTTTSVS